MFNDALLQLTEDVMHLTRNPLSSALVGLAAILTLACSDSIGPPAPTTRAIVVTVSTVGATIDEEAPGAYRLTIDGGRGLPVGVNATVTIGGVSKGNHFIQLDGLAPNCSVDGTNPRHVAVTPGGVALLVTFDVLCVVTAPGGDPSPWDY
jgi:hypothetical protein